MQNLFQSVFCLMPTSGMFTRSQSVTGSADNEKKTQGINKEVDEEKENGNDDGEGGEPEEGVKEGEQEETESEEEVNEGGEEETESEGEENDNDEEEKQDAKKSHNETSRIGMKVYREKNKLNYNTSENLRKRKNKAFEVVGKLCIKYHRLNDSVIDELGDEYAERIEAELEGWNETNSNDESPKGANSCQYCVSFCGTEGCIDGCPCFLELKVCCHEIKSYICAAMPHKAIPKRVEACEDTLGVTERITMDGLKILEDVVKNEVIMEYTGPRFRFNSPMGAAAMARESKK